MRFRPSSGAVKYKMRYKHAVDENAVWVVFPKKTLPDASTVEVAWGSLEAGTAYLIQVRLFGDGIKYTTGGSAWNSTTGSTKEEYKPIVETPGVSDCDEDG